MAKNNDLCCICGKPFDDIYKMGNNAEPFHSGRCCDKCNKMYVIPSRNFAVDLKDNLLTLLKQAQKDIDSGKIPIRPFDKSHVAVWRTNEKKLPPKYKEWRIDFFKRLCKNDKEIDNEVGNLITIITSKSKEISSASIHFIYECGDYGFEVFCD